MKALMMALLGLSAICLAPAATADQGSGNNGSGVNPDVDISMGGNGILFLCPGVGAGVQILGGGGGSCDFDFAPARFGGGHVHCEWGGFVPVAAGWSCWRVFRGQPDHPRLPDPDVICDNCPPRPDALRGPSPDDQAPPPPAEAPEGIEPNTSPLISPPSVPIPLPPFSNTPGLGP